MKWGSWGGQNPLCPEPAEEKRKAACGGENPLTNGHEAAWSKEMAHIAEFRASLG